MSVNCNHKFTWYALDAARWLARGRWVCVKCDTIAPKCFNPKLEAIAL